MRKVVTDWRPGWQERVESRGLTYHSNGGQLPHGVNWNEGAYYELSLAEVDVIEAATVELHEICKKAVSRVLSDEAMALERFQIPETYLRMARESWSREDPSVYGRMDLAWDGGTPKLLEYNADTPTCLVETGVTQWDWLNDKFPEKGANADQFNSLHEKLRDRFGRFGEHVGRRPFYFAANGLHEEEVMTVEYMRDCASQGGLVDTRYIDIRDLGWNPDGRCFVDQKDSPVWYLFKLWPWEWLWREEFGPLLPGVSENVGLVEPPWKMVLSNKAILPVLWDMFPGHPNLLEATWHRDASADLRDGWFSKPILGREGQNVRVARDGRVLETMGEYGHQPVVHQRRARLVETGDLRAVIGSWVVGDEPVGCVFRETRGEIVTGDADVVPHLYNP